MRSLHKIFQETKYNNKPLTSYNEIELRCIVIKLLEKINEIKTKKTSEENT